MKIKAILKDVCKRQKDPKRILQKSIKTAVRVYSTEQLGSFIHYFNSIVENP